MREIWTTWKVRKWVRYEPEVIRESFLPGAGVFAIGKIHQGFDMNDLHPDNLEWLYVDANMNAQELLKHICTAETKLSDHLRQNGADVCSHQLFHRDDLMEQKQMLISRYAPSCQGLSWKTPSEDSPSD